MRRDIGRVVVGLSGGVDSSVVAAMLVEMGYDVIGLFMKNWHDDSVITDNECPWIQDSNDALMVADKLGIPFHVVDMSKQYKEDIVDYMFNSYRNGYTPNPDVMCNYYIKFGHFLNQAKKLGATHVATGHYAKVRYNDSDDRYELFKGSDPLKDQSYFLSMLTQDQLSHALFPLGDFSKTEIRQMASNYGLVTANKKDSQGLCFVGNIKLSDFLAQEMKPKEGNCVHVDTGEVVGTHKGAYYYTRGQGKGMNIRLPYKTYVSGTDVTTNTVYVTGDRNSPHLNDSFLRADVHHLSHSFDINNLTAQITYHGRLYDVTEITVCDDNMEVHTYSDDPFHAASKGQVIVIYDDDKLILSGKIK